MVIYGRFQYKALTENIFGVLGRWSLIGGGRTWKFDCIKRHVLGSLFMSPEVKS